MVIGVLQVEMHLPNTHSLKDKRSVVKSLKDQLRGRFNVAVAELAADEKWQRATSVFQHWAMSARTLKGCFAK